MQQAEPSHGEQAVRALWKSIAERDANLLRLLESVARIVWVTDERGNVLTDPPAAVAHLTWSAFTGISQEALRGQGWLAAVHPDDLQLLAPIMQQAIAAGEPVHCEFRVRAASGAWCWMDGRGNPIRAEDGSILGWIGTCTDISKLKLAEESARQAQKMQALGTLAGGIAHDFNNLLLAIDGNARLALIDLDGHSPTAHSLQEIVKATDRGVDLVRRVLAFAAQGAQSRAATRIVPAIEETLSLLRPGLPTHVQLTTRFADRSTLCALGPAEIRQLIVNLVTNAVYAIGDTPGSIEIALDTHATDKVAILTVADTGCGIDAATVSRIFDPFFTTKPAAKGTGLGLAVVHGIVHGCGGRIEVASTPQRGATFTLRLPLASAGSVAAATTPAPVAAGSGEHLMYVDDDEAIIILIERWFTRHGYRVTCFLDAAEALAAFRRAPDAFDVVITDLSMPRMNGFELVQAVKAIRASVPVVMTSGFVRDEDQARAAAVGATHLLLKPNTIDGLAAALDGLFRRLRAAAPPDAPAPTA